VADLSFRPQSNYFVQGPTINILAVLREHLASTTTTHSAPKIGL